MDAPSVPCTSLFCDGFDDGLGAWHGAQTDPSARVDVVAFGRRGRSLHAQALDGSAVAAVYVDALSPLPPDVYVRAFVYAPAAGTLDLEPIEIADPARTHQIVVGLYDDAIDIHAHAMANDFSKTSLGTTPRERWICLELHVAFGATGRVELFVDSTRVLTHEAVDTRPPSGTLSRLLVGIPSKPTTVASAIYIDDVIVDTQRIGCE